MNGNLQEKRKYNLSNKTGIWLPTSLNNKNIPMVGNMTVSSKNNNDSENNWDSYRMAAVYSANFQTGPGSRLYYHAAELNGTSWVQELIWTQQNDSWSMGATFYDAWPSSHLAATIDENTKILRLFFSSGDLTLSEYYTNISSPNPFYHKGKPPATSVHQTRKLTPPKQASNSPPTSTPITATSLPSPPPPAPPSSTPPPPASANSAYPAPPSPPTTKNPSTPPNPSSPPQTSPAPPAPACTSP